MTDAKGISRTGIRNIIVAVLCSLAAASAEAGFLQMPEIEQPPEAENDPYLLKDLDIPSVRERNVNPQAGPRLNVTSFRIQGIVEFPELDITREKLTELVENIRYDIMDEGDIRFAGFTEEEIGELGELIVDIEKESRGEHVTPYDVQRLVFLVREQHRRRGVTLGMLENVADQITDYYRKRGFFLAKAFVPEQRVRDGVVTLTVMLGELGSAPLRNSELYSQKVIDRVVGDAFDKPVTHETMEEKLYHLNDLPGLTVQGLFSTGVQVGDTALQLNVLDEDRYNVNLRVDNHGSDVTGEYRLYADYTLNNPLNYGDYLKVAILGAVEPEHSTYGSLHYGGPLFHYRWGYNLSLSRNAFTLALEQGDSANFNIGGISNEKSAGIQYKLARSRVNTSSLSLGVSHIDASLRYITDNRRSEFNHDVTLNTTFSYHFDILQDTSQTLHKGSVQLVHSRVIDSLLYSEGTFDDTWIFRADYTTLKFVSMPFDWKDARLVARAAVQYADQQLLSINQFGLAGPTRARAYKTNTFFADDGFHVGAELIFNSLPFGVLREQVQPYLMADAAYGETHLPEDAGINRADLANLGVGLKLFPIKGMRGNISIAKSVRSRISNDLNPGESDGWKVYADFQYGL